MVSGGLSGLGVELVRAGWERGCVPLVVGRHVNRETPEVLSQIPFRRVERGEYPATQDLLSESVPKDCTQITLCLNAATIEPLGKAGDLNAEKVKQAIEVNFLWPIELVQQFLNIAAERQLPLRIVLITTGAASKAIKDWSIYCSTKAAVEHFIRCVAVDYPSVPCRAIDPGLIDTPMQEFLTSWEAKDPGVVPASRNLRPPREVAKRVLDETGFWK